MSPRQKYLHSYYALNLTAQKSWKQLKIQVDCILNTMLVSLMACHCLAIPGVQ